jgi:peptidoglycan-associated lipoprotein
LYKILVENPNITVELAAHTDSRSPDKYNLDLSYKRAKSCVDYLISKGVSGDRITPKGYGESRPLEYTVNGKKIVLTEKYINSFKTVEEREALHQQNRRVVFSVLRTDYVEKNKTPEEKAKTPDIKVVDDNATGEQTKPAESTPKTEGNSTAPKTEDKPKE